MCYGKRGEVMTENGWNFPSVEKLVKAVQQIAEELTKIRKHLEGRDTIVEYDGTPIMQRINDEMDRVQENIGGIYDLKRRT